MRNHLRLLTIAALSACSMTSYGQGSSPNKSIHNIPDALRIFNSNIIGNGLESRLDSKKIKEIVVYKGQDGPGVLKDMTSAGILAITYDGQISSKSFAEIGAQYGLHSPLSFVLNGHKLDSAQLAFLRIAPEAIGKIAIIPAAAGTPETTVNIQLAEAKTASKSNAPGTVMIR